METLETLRSQIATTQDLQSVVRTMKSLAAASIRQYDHAVISLRQYSGTIRRGFQIALRGSPLTAQPEPTDPTWAIVIGSDYGLCGRFNEQIVDFAISSMKGEGQEVRPAVHWLALGLRAAARLEAEGFHPYGTLPLPITANRLAGSVYSLLLEVDRWHKNHPAGRMLVFHNMRQRAEGASPRRVQLLPLDPAWLGRLARQRWDLRTLPMFTMNREVLLSALIRQHLFVTLYRAAAESLASEHASRLAAMQVAERNIDEHLAEVTAGFHRKRQEVITSEMLEIIAGFEASKTR